jgi:hypothetical protein
MTALCSTSTMRPIASSLPQQALENIQFCFQVKQELFRSGLGPGWSAVITPVPGSTRRWRCVASEKQDQVAVRCFRPLERFESVGRPDFRTT